MAADWFPAWMNHHAARHHGAAPDPRCEAGALDYRTVREMFRSLGITETDAHELTAQMCLLDANRAAHLPRLAELARALARKRQQAAAVRRADEAFAKRQLEQRQQWQAARACWNATPEADRRATLKRLAEEYPGSIRSPRWLEAMALVALMGDPNGADSP